MCWSDLENKVKASKSNHFFRYPSNVSMQVWPKLAYYFRR